MVSSIFRLTMAVSSGEHMHASDIFDGIVRQLEQEARATARIEADAQDTITNAFLARDIARDMMMAAESAPPTLRIHPDEPSAVPESYVENAAFVKGADVKVMKTEPASKDEHTVKLTYANSIFPEVQIAKVIGADKAMFPPVAPNTTPTKNVVDLMTEEEGEAVEETEEEVVEEEGEAVEETEEVEEEVVEETEEVEEEVVEETEEVEEEVVEETEEVEEEVEEEVVEETEEVEEEAEEEEEGMEVIKIGKKKYFCGETSRNVYVYINDEEAGDCLGRYENGKIVPL
jgi:hypothetical protein